jgi:cyclophilin family peptidyl-prolyl cis-trans isomerase
MAMEMPHSIDHFLRMVEKKLWDGLALVHEPTSSVIMATPMTMDDSHTWAGQRFVEEKLTHMAFNEYSPTFPAPHHRKFTVAFSGRPGGPSFYINLDDELEETHLHESTFGVVVEGRDVLMKLTMQKQGKMDKTMLTIESIELPKANDSSTA